MTFPKMAASDAAHCPWGVGFEIDPLTVVKLSVVPKALFKSACAPASIALSDGATKPAAVHCGNGIFVVAAIILAPRGPSALADGGIGALFFAVDS